VDRAAAEDDDACTEKADARDDLSCHARRVDDYEPFDHHVLEPVLADQEDQRRRRSDDGLRPQSCALPLDFAFETDQCRQPEGHEQLDDLTGALTRSAEEGRIGQPEMHADKVSRPVHTAMSLGPSTGQHR
jgi:hypothetical protein